ncbi:MAG TPA: hypothetical protein ENJ32_11315 [Crenotrichaceae bacterium]|nr:hypothetical protein [Crenotrichaceae bacterium]
MNHLQSDNSPTNGITMINLLLIVLFIGVIISGFSLSTEKISAIENSISKNHIMQRINQTFQIRHNSHSILPKQNFMSVASNDAQLTKQPESTTAKESKISQDNNARAMLGMFVVMLKKG